MNKRKIGSALVWGVLATGVVACSATSEVDEGQDAVATATCPESLELKIQKPKLDAAAITKDEKGKTLGAAEVAKVTAAIKRAKGFGTTSVRLRLDQKSAGVCNYISPISNAPTAPRARIGGTALKPSLELSFGDFMYRTKPASISKREIALTSGDNTEVLASLGSGFGASYAKLGKTRIEATVTSIPSKGSIKGITEEITSVLDKVGPGRNDDYKVSGNTPIALVKSYILAKRETLEDYTFQENAKEMVNDAEIAGTLPTDLAISQSVASLESWVVDSELANPSKELEALLRKLAAAGATFGFDGFEQHGCAAPTYFLLVIDSKDKHVYGIDLNPCSES